MVFSAFGAEEKEAVLMLSTYHPNNVPFVATFNGELYLRHYLLGKKVKVFIFKSVRVYSKTSKRYKERKKGKKGKRKDDENLRKSFFSS